MHESWGTLNNEILCVSENDDPASGFLQDSRATGIKIEIWSEKGQVRCFSIPKALFFCKIRTSFCSYVSEKGSSLKL